MFAQCAETHSVLSELLKNFSAEKFSQKLFSSDFKRQRLRDLKKGCFESEFFVGVGLLTFSLPVILSPSDSKCG